MCRAVVGHGSLRSLASGTEQSYVPSSRRPMTGASNGRCANHAVDAARPTRSTRYLVMHGVIDRAHARSILHK